MRGAAAVEIYIRGKRQKTIEVECLWQKFTPAKDGSRARETG